MTITVSVPDQLADQAQAAGLSVESYIEQILQQQAQERAVLNSTRASPGPLTPEQAVDDIRELRKGVSLGGLKIRDLINEGRKY